MIVKHEISKDSVTYWVCADKKEEIAEFASTCSWHGKNTISICSWFGTNAKEEWDKFWRIVEEVEKLKKEPP